MGSIGGLLWVASVHCGSHTVGAVQQLSHLSHTTAAAVNTKQPFQLSKVYLSQAIKVGEFFSWGLLGSVLSLVGQAGCVVSPTPADLSSLECCSSLSARFPGQHASRACLGAIPRQDSSSKVNKLSSCIPMLISRYLDLLLFLAVYSLNLTLSA